MIYRVMGAKHFLDMPVGIFFVELDRENTRLSVLEQVKLTLESIKSGKCEFWVYIDNSCAMSYGDEEVDYEVTDLYNPDNHFIWDHNVVGDALPSATLYLIIPESVIPEKVKFDSGITLSKNQILIIRDNLIRTFPRCVDNATNPNNEWAKKFIQEHYMEPLHPVVNYLEEFDILDGGKNI